MTTHRMCCLLSLATVFALSLVGIHVADAAQLTESSDHEGLAFVATISRAAPMGKASIVQR